MSLFGGAGDFAGMNQNQQEQFKTALTKYISSINNILQGFQTHAANVEQALKGEKANPALKEYLEVAKAVLDDYINRMNEEFNFLEQASAKYTSEQASLGAKIQGKAEDLRSEAGKFQLDQ